MAFWREWRGGMRARESVCSRLGRKVVRKGVKGYINGTPKSSRYIGIGVYRIFWLGAGSSGTEDF